MFILEEPYVSDLLVATVGELGLPVLRTPMAERRLPAALGDLLRDDADFATAARTPGARLYSNSENAIGWIAAHLAGSDLPRSIELFKDKLAFRDLVADLYPDYRYAGVPAGELRAFDPTPTGAVRGQAGGGLLQPRRARGPVRRGMAGDRARDRARGTRAGPPLSAAGAGPGPLRDRRGDHGRGVRRGPYYDADGAPVLVNVYAHLFSSAEDVSDRVYYTDAATVARLGPPAEEFLAEFGRRAGLADFPVHTELRVDDAGRVAPIEVNPMRFGGWCATDLAHFAHGLDPYRCYLIGERPDWARIAAETAGRTTALIVADLPSTVDLAAIASVDYEGFAGRFSRVLELRPTDYNRYPVFAFTFVEVASDDLSELHAVLGADLREHLRMA